MYYKIEYNSWNVCFPFNTSLILPSFIHSFSYRYWFFFSCYSSGFISSFFPVSMFLSIWRLFECLLLLLPSLPYAGCHIICSTCIRIIGRTLHHQIMFHICFSHFIGWLCQIVWLIQSFIIGWIADFGIIFKKLCASVASIYGNKMNCWKVKQCICPIQCRLIVDPDHVSNSKIVLWLSVIVVSFVWNVDVLIEWTKNEHIHINNNKLHQCNVFEWKLCKAIQ